MTSFCTRFFGFPCCLGVVRDRSLPCFGWNDLRDNWRATGFDFGFVVSFSISEGIRGNRRLVFRRHLEDVHENGHLFTRRTPSRS